MITTCANKQNCGFDLGDYPITIELDGQRRTLTCPVCGSPISRDRESPEIREIPDLDISYDDVDRCYVKWVGPAEASAGPRQLAERVPDTGSKLELTVRVKTQSFRDLFYDHVLVFMLDDQLLPLQLFAPPENCRRYGIAVLSCKVDPDNSRVTVGFELKKGSTTFCRASVVLPAAVTKATTVKERVNNGSALLVWPNFKRPDFKGVAKADDPQALAEQFYPGWKNYFIYFASTDGDIKVEWMRVIGSAQGEEVHIDARALGLTPRGEVGFPPEFIEIGAEVSKDDISRPYRASFAVQFSKVLNIQPPFTPQPADGGPASEGRGVGKVLNLSVDFGTSNTCFYYVIPGQQEGDRFNPEPVRLSDRTLYLVKGLQLENDLTHTWLPIPNAGQELIPSELVFNNEPQLVFGRTADPQPIVDYTLPPLRWRPGEQRQTCTGFKWEKATEPKVLQPRHTQLQKKFLSLAFKLVMAEMVSDEALLGGSGNLHPCKVNLTVTYPLAMTASKFRELLDSFNHVRREIESATGITVDQPYQVDESLAGEVGTATEGGGKRVFIDVGGGTTDISVVEEIRGQGRRALISDSVRFAGNDLLVALANDERGGRLSSKSLIELQRRIRTDRDVLKNIATFDGDGARLREAQEALENFLRGLSHYLARVVALVTNGAHGPAVAEGEDLNLYLLGNGWNFALASAPPPRRGASEANGPEVIRSEVERRLRAELELLKQAGIISVVPQTKINIPPDPKTVVARGALLAQTSAGGVKKEDPKTFMGSNVRVVLPGHQMTYGWDASVPVDLGENARAVYISGAVAGFERDRVHDDQFGDKYPISKLEEINISPSVHDDGWIIRNALGVYLERWYKRYLSPRGWLK